MPVKAIVVPKQELQEAVENILKQEGKNVTSVEITLNEKTEEDVAIVKADGVQFERKVESFIAKLNQVFSVDIHTYDGFDYPDFAGQAGGYVFLIN
jgi:hypothetical protein